MKRSRVFLLALIPAALIMVALGFFFSAGLSKKGASPAGEEENSSFIDLGVTYVPVTPGLSAYYNLGIDFGALVTEVTPNSIADKAGLQTGDVILSFNGAQVDDRTSLLGMIMACPEGSSITLEVWRGQSSKVIGLAHTEIKETSQ